MKRYPLIPRFQLIHPGVPPLKLRLPSAGTKAQQHSQHAAAYKTGNPDLAAFHQEQADKWSAIDSIEMPGGLANARDCYERAKAAADEGIDLLLAFSCKGEDTIGDLCELFERIASGLNALAANGNETAVKACIQSAYKSVNIIEDLETRKIKALEQIAPTCADWPAFISPLRSIQNRNEDKIEALKIGQKSPFQMKEAKWQIDTVAINVALQLYRYVNGLRQYSAWIESEYVNSEDKPNLPEWFAELKALQDYSTETAKDWFKVCWAILMELTDNRPEQNPWLRRIGEYRKKHYVRVGGEEATRTDNSNIRDGIKTVLKKAFIKTLPNSYL